MFFLVVENPGDQVVNLYQLQRITSELPRKLIVQVDNVLAE